MAFKSLNLPERDYKEATNRYPAMILYTEESANKSVRQTKHRGSKKYKKDKKL